MTDPQHERLRSLFDRALEASPEERAALLARECAGDDELRRRLLVMLAAAEGEQFLAAPTALEIKGLSDADCDSSALLREGPGTRIGHYKLLQQIGEGGFGVVFMAEQLEPVKRTVALKIIKLGMDTRQVVARFEQERQALALMDHPNIARVIDAGATATGRPYFVMELVRGDPISEYCDKHTLTIDERLELFAQVCGAVQHAHGKGIIHRDLKPSNVLVAVHDGRPLAKVIDFGIAKATSAKLTEKTLFTEHQQVIGTFQYMSPEQAEGSLDIDTRTDVYALGVVLYELLTGSTPFDAHTLHDAFVSEIQRMIRDVEPPKPSTRISNAHDTLASVAARRRVEPKRLGTIVRGELDWIVMKALEKDRARRYDTASGLADDVRRYLTGEAVLAAPPSASYRVRKFVRRHRFGVIAASLVSIALLAGLAGTAWGMLAAQRGRVEAELQTRRADEARREAELQRADADAQRDAAESARTQTQRVADFQASMLRRVPPFEMGRDLAQDLVARVRSAQAELDLPDEQRARTVATFEGLLGGISMTDAARRIIDANVLTPSSQAIEAEFKEEPLTQAALHESVANTYHDLGIFGKAKLQAQREVELREKIQGPDHRATLLAKVTLGIFCQSLGEPDEARRILEEVLPEIERVLGAEHRSALLARMCLGVLALEQRRNDEARASFEQVLAIQERTLGPDHADVALTLENLGTALLNLAQPDRAVPPLERASAIRQRARGADDSHTLRSQQKLAAAYQALQRYDDAYRLHLEAIETLSRIEGANHPYTIHAIAELAALYSAQSRFVESEAQARRALALRRVALGNAHPRTIDSMTDVAIACANLGRHDEATQLFAEAVERSTQTLGADSAKTMGRVSNLAVSYWYQGKYSEVEPLFARVLAFNRREFGDESTETAFAMANMAILLHKLGRLNEERPLLEQALEIHRKQHGETHESTLRSKAGLAVFYFDTGEVEEAEALFRELVEAQARVLGENHPSTLETKANLALVLVDSDRVAEAEALLLDVLERRRTTMGVDNRETLRALREVIRLYTNTERLEQARPLVEELIDGWKRAAAATDATPGPLNECALILIEAPIHELREPQLALEYARRANALTGDAQPEYLHTLARVLHANGDHAGAIETIRKALALLPAEAPDRSKLEEHLHEFEAAKR
ncbi:MAG: tetratricopeptide repeat protein [Planctomycetota bacterium]